MFEFIQQNSTSINALATVTLVLITAYYAYLTRRILVASDQQSKLSLDPVIGIKINKIEIGEVYTTRKRRSMTVYLELTNVGNAPAIEVLVDSEVQLRYSNINGHKNIPARIDPDVIPFIRPGEKLDECHQNFGNNLITHFFDDVRESTRLNLHRIDTDPTQESFKTSRLKIFTYYRNSLGQNFMSRYEIEIDLFAQIGDDPIPKDDQKVVVSMSYIPRPIYKAEPISIDKQTNDIEVRNNKRDLCGW